jgi:hypothetical protein
MYCLPAIAPGPETMLNVESQEQTLFMSSFEAAIHQVKLLQYEL